MLPPRHPHSPRSTIYNQAGSANQIAQRKTNSRQKQRYSGLSSLDSKTRTSRFEHLRTPQQKRKALNKKRYINQLAYLDYEDKHIEIHTKYTMASKISAMKKIKAKNQMAEFIQQQEEQELGFQELMDYKYGKNLAGDYFFEKQQLTAEYQFCPQCDAIHNDHVEVHQKICQSKTSSSEQFNFSNPSYVILSLQRIFSALKRTSGQQYDSLRELVEGLISNQLQSLKRNTSKKINSKSTQIQRYLTLLQQLRLVNKNDRILSQIIQKVLFLYRKNSR